MSNKYLEGNGTYPRNNELDDELFHWLTKNSVIMQGDLGILGKIEYVAPFNRYTIKNYEVIINTLPKFRDSTIQIADIQFCDDAILRYLGLLEKHIAAIQKDHNNPLKWFQSGLQIVISFPVYLLKMFGIITDDSFSKITGNVIYKIIVGIIGLAAFISSIVTIIQGRKETINYFKSVFDKKQDSITPISSPVKDTVIPNIVETSIMPFENQKAILDTFPLPTIKFHKLTKKKTADEYFESACGRSLDYPGDSLVNFYCLREYQYAIKLDKTFWHAYRNISRCFCRIKRDDLALESLTLAFKYCPNLDNATELYEMRGQIEYRQGNYGNAVKDFQKLVDVGYSPLADSYYKLAKATLKLGQKEKAKEIIKSAKDIDFSDYDLKQFGL